MFDNAALNSSDICSRSVSKTIQVFQAPSLPQKAICMILIRPWYIKKALPETSNACFICREDLFGPSRQAWKVVQWFIWDVKSFFWQRLLSAMPVHPYILHQVHAYESYWRCMYYLQYVGKKSTNMLQQPFASIGKVRVEWQTARKSPQNFYIFKGWLSDLKMATWTKNWQEVAEREAKGRMATYTQF